MRFAKIAIVVALLVVAVIIVKNNLNAIAPGVYADEGNTSRIVLDKDGTCYVEEGQLSSSGGIQSVKVIIG